MLRVKICGLTRVEDARVALDAGAWALGFVFHRASPRYIEPAKVRILLDELAREGRRPTKSVGVFVNTPLDSVRQIQKESGISTVQLHGDESLDVTCQLRDLDLIKACRPGTQDDLRSMEAYWPYVSAILCDGAAPGAYGGTGTKGDWNLARELSARGPVILAGGLRAENIVEAIRVVQPYAVDLSSGVETEPGIKDPAKIAALFAALKGVYGKATG